MKTTRWGNFSLKKPLQEAIRAGLKRTTIRRWNRPMVREGQRAFSPGLGWLRIDKVECVELDKLSDADALADGFATLAALRDVLVSFYPDRFTDGKHWFRVAFKLTQPLPRRTSRAEHRQLHS